MKSFKEYKEAKQSSKKIIKTNLEALLLHILEDAEFLRKLDADVKMNAVKVFKKFLDV